MFFTDGKLRGLEKFMSLPRYPKCKGGGTYRSSYNYTKGDCECLSFFYCINFQLWYNQIDK